MTNDLYTIGYASFSMDEFIHTLKKYDITALADVRSAPYSKFKPDFKKENLHKALTDNNISYSFLGAFLGARLEGSSCYIDGKLNYNLLKETEKFKMGIKRILKGMKYYRIALMCAEKDPVNCHRTFLVCRTLRSYPLRILHILGDGSLEVHSITEKRLEQLYLTDQPDIFHPEKDGIEEVYDRMCEKIILYDK